MRGELERHEVRVLTGIGVTEIIEGDARLAVISEGSELARADIVLVVVGVRPQTTLALAAAVATGQRGAIQVDRRMQTNLADVYAAGDCVVTYHRLLDADSYLPLGTTAHKQGRVAGENALGGDRRFEGSLGTQVVKVFDLAVARSGLRDHEAEAAGFDPTTVEAESVRPQALLPGRLRDRHPYHRRPADGAPASAANSSVTSRRRCRSGSTSSATALHHAMTVDAISDLDLSYTPPFGSPWDAVQIAAQAWRSQSAAFAGLLPRAAGQGFEPQLPDPEE